MKQGVNPVIAHLHQVNEQREIAEQTGKIRRVHELQAWQCERLRATHTELAAQPRYQKAMEFFVDELYGPKDFSQRDADLARVIPKLSKVLPPKAMAALDDALALNALSFELDIAMVDALGEQPLTRSSYAHAYRTVGRQADREKQLNLITHLGQQLSDVVKIKGIGILLKLAKRPAKLAGLLTLHEFLERGFNAFKALGSVDSFIAPVIAREQELMIELFNPDINLVSENPLPHVR